jgi:FHA domain/Cysteine-rich secretory protein family
VLRAQPARLLATDKNGPGPRLVLLRRTDATIGSAPGNTVELAATGVAAHHAQIRWSRGRYYLTDFKVGRGTRVNGRAMRRRHRLRHGDQISFGEAPPYRFIDPDAEKRLGNRRILRAGAAAGVIALAIGAHGSGWDGGVLSPEPIAQLIESAASPIEHIAARTPAAPPAHLNTAAAAGEHSAPATAAKPAAAKISAKSAAAPVPSAAPSVSVAAESGSEWIERLNHYRTMAGVPALKEDRKLSAAMAAHAHYLMSNYAAQIRTGEPLGNSAHDEEPSKPGYTPTGKAAAYDSQLAWGCGGYNATTQIADWIAGPFNRFAMLNPSIVEAGFGEASSDGCWVAGLRLPPGHEEVKAYAHAIEFPPGGAEISLAWAGLEWPDPLTGCPGYTAPAGLPITLQLGRLVATDLSAHSLTSNGETLQSCAFDSHSYHNPTQDAQEYGRWALRSSGAIVVIPRAPLVTGAQYSVSITAHGQVYAWSFRVSQ